MRKMLATLEEFANLSFGDEFRYAWSLWKRCNFNRMESLFEVSAIAMFGSSVCRGSYSPKIHSVLKTV